MDKIHEKTETRQKTKSPFLWASEIEKERQEPETWFGHTVWTVFCCLSEKYWNTFTNWRQLSQRGWTLIEHSLLDLFHTHICCMKGAYHKTLRVGGRCHCTRFTPFSYLSNHLVSPRSLYGSNCMCYVFLHIFNASHNSVKQCKEPDCQITIKHLNTSENEFLLLLPEWQFKHMQCLYI